ncbi:MAG: hypothetical protein EON94_16090, partial [Caulobacteraceae bacterium]
MSVTANTDALLNLARSRAPADRERLLLAVVDLCGASDKTQLSSAPIQAQLQSIFMNLVVEAEWDIRRRLSEKLASATWAPSALVSVLAFDDIEIARPIIAVSPVLILQHRADRDDRPGDLDIVKGQYADQGRRGPRRAR